MRRPPGRTEPTNGAVPAVPERPVPARDGAETEEDAAATLRFDTGDRTLELEDPEEEYEEPPRRRPSATGDPVPRRAVQVASGRIRLHGAEPRPASQGHGSLIVGVGHPGPVRRDSGASPGRARSAELPPQPAVPAARAAAPVSDPGLCQTIEEWHDASTRAQLHAQMQAAASAREAVSAHRAALVVAGQHPGASGSWVVQLWRGFLALLGHGVLWGERRGADAPRGKSRARTYGAKTTTQIASLVELKRQRRGSDEPG
jgi:hypothetical protein